MLTRNEMKKYCDMLDKEYAEEIKPMLEKAQKAVDDVIAVLDTKEYTDACKRMNSEGVKYGHLSAWQCDLGAFGYYGDTTNNFKMTHYAPSCSMIDLCGYSARAYGDNATLWALVNAADAYRNNDVAVLALLKEKKEKFNTIRFCFNRFFVENGGEKFKSFSAQVMWFYNTMMEGDRKADADFYALFGTKPEGHSVKITITIEHL